MTINHENIQTATAPCGSTTFPIASPTAVQLPIELQCCNERFPITMEESHSLEERTVNQNSSSEWHEARKTRLTASTFGKVLKRKKKVNETFLKSIISPRQFSSAATRYGTKNEVNGKQEYLHLRPTAHLHDCGLVVNPNFSFLGASPDAKVCDNGEIGILEVKCPFNAKNKTIVEALEDTKFCLFMNSGCISLKDTHDYYYQVQGQLLVTGAAFCDFIVHTNRDNHLQRILPNKEFQENILNKLAQFYHQHIIPYLDTQQNLVQQPIMSNNSAES